MVMVMIKILQILRPEKGLRTIINETLHTREEETGESGMFQTAQKGKTYRDSDREMKQNEKDTNTHTHTVNTGSL